MELLKNETKMGALDDIETTVQVDVPKKNSPSASIATEGKKIIGSLSREEREIIGDKSFTVQVMEILSLGSVKDMVAGSKRGSTIPAAKPVGMLIKALEDIEVPQIPILLNETTGIPEDQVTYITVKAGQEVQLSYIEAMFLILREEYAGMFGYKEDPENHVKLIPKVAGFMSKRRPLPTPSFSLRTGSIKLNPYIIDELAFDEDGMEVVKIKKGFEKFAPLVEKPKSVKAAARVNRGTNEVYTSTQAVAVALAGMFREKGLMK